MSDHELITYCAPTLAGLKSGNLFSTKCSDETKLRQEIAALNKQLLPKGLRIIPIRSQKGRMLIYLYRPEALKTDLSERDARAILEAKGYTVSNPDICVAEMAKRIRSEESFPHEIGLFLSYPPADVRGFMEHREEGCVCLGTWRVYSNVEKARHTFDLYEKCTKSYRHQYQKGKALCDLTVSTDKH